MPSSSSSDSESSPEPISKKQKKQQTKKAEKDKKKKDKKKEHKKTNAAAVAQPIVPPINPVVIPGSPVVPIPSVWAPNYSSIKPVIFSGSSDKGWGWTQRGSVATFSIGHFKPHEKGGMFKDMSKRFINLSVEEIMELLSQKDQILYAQTEVAALEETRM